MAQPAPLPRAVSPSPLVGPVPEAEMTRLSGLIDHRLLRDARALLTLLRRHFSATPELQTQSARLARSERRQRIIAQVEDAQRSYAHNPGTRVASRRRISYHTLADHSLQRLFAGCDRATFDLLLEQTLQPEQPRVNRAMVRLIGLLADRRGVALLVRLAHDRTRPSLLRQTAIGSLLAIGGTDNGEAIIDLCGHSDPLLAARAIDASLRLLRDKFRPTLLTLKQRSQLAHNLERWTANRVLSVQRLIHQRSFTRAATEIRLLRWLDPTRSGPVVSLCNELPWSDVALLIAADRSPAAQQRWSTIRRWLVHPEAKR